MRETRRREFLERATAALAAPMLRAAGGRVSPPFAMHLTMIDFSQNWGKSPRPWGMSGVRSLLDSVLETGIATVYWRSNTRGRDYPTEAEAAERARPGAAAEADSADFGPWDSLGPAVQYAHSRGIEIWAWYDQTDSHGGCGGRKTHNSFLLKHPYTTRCPLPGGRPSPVEVAEHRDPNCPLRGRGTQASLAFPEVQDFRLGFIRKVVGKGVDGVYIVENGSIGFEEPVTRSFRKAWRRPPGAEIDPADPRWLAHQAKYLVDYLKRVRAATASRPKPCQLILELRGLDKRAPGLRPYVARALPQLFREDVVDGVAVWTTADVYTLRDDLRIPPTRIRRRYEFPRDLDPAAIQSTFREMLAAGVAVVGIDEATDIERKEGWSLFKRFVAQAPAS